MFEFRLCSTLVLCTVAALSVGCAGFSGSLPDLCAQHRTDKCEQHHNYVELYVTVFEPVREEAKRVLEIGVLDGDSVRMWEAYFPRAMIFGIDIVDTSQHETERIRTFIGDQANRAQLAEFAKQFGSDFDIVIDDGGHTMEQQQVSFGFFFPLVKSGGIYIIEDIHTSFPDRYPGYGVSENEANSTFTMITNFVRSASFRSEYLTESELAVLNAQVDHCLYTYRPNEFHSDFFLCYKK
jgi:demethylmacrocin O-methyltransferase